MFKLSNTTLLILIQLILGSHAMCQNGRILDHTPYTLHDTLIAKIEKVFPNARKSIAENNYCRLTYLSDGLRIKGFIGMPKKSGSFPCIIFNRGGNKDFSKLTESLFISLIGSLVDEGYIVVASQYRGNDGGDGIEEFGGKDVHDVLNLIPLLANLPQADTSRIGMFGWSRGGMMTYLALTKTNKIKAAVVGSGAADLVGMLETRPDFDSTVYPELIPDYKKDKLNLLKQRSAVYFADKINKNTPILILQGSGDWRVPTDQVLNLVGKFYKYHQPFRFILYEGGQHSLIEHRKDYTIQMINWFNNYLRDGKRWPSLDPHGN